MLKHLSDSHLKKTLIFCRDIVESMCLVRGYDDTDLIVHDIIKFEGFYPGLVRNIGNIVFSSDRFFDGKPVVFDIIHC
jgi:hypothetical protein